MSGNVLRHAVVLGILVSFGTGCGGDKPDAIESSGGDTSSAPATPAAGSGAADPTMMPGMTTLPTATASSGSGGVIVADTPEATAQVFFNAIKENKLENIWELLPRSHQTGINELFREFGKQVDAEVWDKSFNLINRYMSALIAKEEFMFGSPAFQMQMAQTKQMVAIGGMSDTSWLDEAKIKEITKPFYDMTLALLNSEIATKKKLETFEGKVFFAKTLSPVLKNLRALIEQGVEIAKQSEQLKQNPQAQMMLAQFDINTLLSKVKFRTEAASEDSAILVIEMEGEQPTKVPMSKVEGKWIPTQMAGMMPFLLQQGKTMMPGLANQVNAVKDRVVPVLAEIEPLVESLQKASNQEEFNKAMAALQTTGAQKVATAMGAPGLGSAFGGGSVSISKVTVEVNEELSGDRLRKLIEDLESLTDEPPAAILLPKIEGGKTIIEITPVSDFEKFISGVTFAEVIDRPAGQSVAVIKLPAPVVEEPVETEEEKK